MARAPLTRERILDTAIDIVDERGLKSLTMRGLGESLGVEAMSLYHHVPNKQALLAAIADRVVARFALPDPELPWQAAIRASAVSAHDELVRHPWALSILIDQGVMSHARMTFYDAMLGCLRRAGFSTDVARRAFLAIDSHVLGFTVQEIEFPLESGDVAARAEAAAAQIDPEALPYIAEMAAAALETDEWGWDFGFGLDLMLESLARRLTR